MQTTEVLYEYLNSVFRGNVLVSRNEGNTLDLLYESFYFSHLSKFP